jgi:hydrogenase-4 component F
LGILRTYQICLAVGLGDYCREIFIVFGLLSVVFAAIFILGQTDYKRMLAYSSVEHMGVIILGIGFGQSAVWGALINLLGHSLTKAGLFFIAGNILSYYQTKNIADIQGMITKKTRWLGFFWLAGFLLIIGTPPSGIFLGKFLILKQALAQQHYWFVFIFLAALAMVFIGMAKVFINMTQGETKEKDDKNLPIKNIFLRICPAAIFFLLAVIIGIYLPRELIQVLENAVRELGGF